MRLFLTRSELDTVQRTMNCVIRLCNGMHVISLHEFYGCVFLLFIGRQGIADEPRDHGMAGQTGIKRAKGDGSPLCHLVCLPLTRNHSKSLLLR